MIVLPQNIQQISYIWDVRTILFFDNSPQKIDPPYKELFVPRNGYIFARIRDRLRKDSWHWPIQTTWSRQAIVTYRNDDVPYRNPIYMGVKQNVSKIQNLRHLDFEQNLQDYDTQLPKKKHPKELWKA